MAITEDTNEPLEELPVIRRPIHDNDPDDGEPDFEEL